ncbi:hypothetical protein C8258_26985 [Nocardia sp. MDA0666]|uniref:WXG100 family type VII secretion target n=1 Tax=Nocardia sp. MDA0666 TaxID=2135448 RepID=UPI000D135E93|nr:hypothetical protein [Nocardia sp. MDA0666]PSR61175.1 hypothetical protein C8258_26985 [Nocardia sp. MDA0666]
MATGNENPRITNGGENPDSWTHQKIYDSFVGLNTTEANHGCGEYEEIARRWNSAAELFAARIHNSSSAAWEGPAATSTRDAINRYAQRALDLVTPLNQLAQRVSSTVDGVDKTRTIVDKPPAHASGWNPTSWQMLGMHGPSSPSVRGDCENAAREAMRDHYVKQFVAADGQIPVLPVPDNPADPLYKPPGTAVAPPPAGPGPGPGPGPANSTPGPGQPGSPTDNTPSTSPSSTAPSSTTPSGLGSPANSPTTPSAVDPSGSGASTMPSGLSGGAGGLSGGGYPGGGLGGLPGGSTPGGPGRSVLGGPAGTAANAAATGGALGGRTGTSGMPGMGGLGGAKGKSEGEEKTHDLPEWLRNMENTEELLGPAPRTIPGGVIGGDYAEPPTGSG